jgi:hypothetical protein
MQARDSLSCLINSHTWDQHHLVRYRHCHAAYKHLLVLNNDFLGFILAHTFAQVLALCAALSDHLLQEEAR